MPAQPPYGVPVGTWKKTVGAAGALAGLVDDEGTPSDIIGAAQALRTLVREYV